MRTVIVVQARMTSTRLPGKVLMPVGGRPMLAQQIRRLRQCRLAQEIAIATTTNSSDDPIAEIAWRDGVCLFRGSESDVLGRYLGAARKAYADVVVRVTADCPLIDAGVTDRVIGELLARADACDYASNVFTRTWPRGLDTEAFFMDTLARMERLGKTALAREHVTVVARAERPELFLCHSVVDEHDNSDLRWTVDTAEDLRLVRTIYEELELGEHPKPYAEILAWVRSRSDLVNLNRGIETWDPHAEPAHTR
jgi:spore coat polysaccharide biosynthesis protein SpsF